MLALPGTQFIIPQSLADELVLDNGDRLSGPLMGHQFYESLPLNLLLELGLVYVYEDFVTEPAD